jgi:predicted transcriptional regulator
MKLGRIKELLDAEVLVGEEKLDMEAIFVFGCDLMSDVLSMVTGETILLTGVTNIQVVRTAEMMDIKCIIFVRGKKPNDQVIKLAQEKGICLMSTKNIMFSSCGILYSKGLKGAGIENAGLY